jgi:signal transduction histidine kinase
MRHLSWARVVLAAVAVTAAGLYSLGAWPAGVLLGLFLAASVLAAIRGPELGRLLGMAGLFVDTVYFLVLVYFGGEGMLWLAAVFYLYLLTAALVFSGPVEVAVITTGSAIFCAILPSPAIYVLEPMVIVAGVLAGGFAAHKRRLTEHAQLLAARLDAAEKAVEKAREEERQRIASDFHDGPLQNFISLQMRIEILRKLFDRDPSAGLQDLKQLQALAQSQVRDLRTFLHSMRPVDVDGGNLVVALRRTVESFQKESGIPVAFVSASTPVGLPPEVTMEVLQMLREALHNVQKHAGASRAAVGMDRTERGLELSVDDNGRGFNFAGSYTLDELELLRLGPASLKRRARSLNADMLLESRPGSGAGIKFRIPLQ